MAGPPRLLDRMRGVLRTRHYSIRTEDAYVQWAKRFILFHRKRHPSAMGAVEINEYLTHLAVERNVFASTQTQAYNETTARAQDMLAGLSKPTIALVQGVCVGSRVDGNAAYPHLPARADDAEGHLPPVRNEDLGDHRPPRSG